VDRGHVTIRRVTPYLGDQLVHVQYRAPVKSLLSFYIDDQAARITWADGGVEIRGGRVVVEPVEWGELAFRFRPSPNQVGRPARFHADLDELHIIDRIADLETESRREDNLSGDGQPAQHL
jgi:hypothetical protein